jgi:hypothetical protein
MQRPEPVEEPRAVYRMRKHLLGRFVAPCTIRLDRETVVSEGDLRGVLRRVEEANRTVHYGVRVEVQDQHPLDDEVTLHVFPERAPSDRHWHIERKAGRPVRRVEEWV